MIIMTKLTDHQTSGTLWWHLESSFCIHRTSFGCASWSHPLHHQMSPPYLEHYYQQYFVQQMGTYWFFCSGRDRRSIFCCWNRQDRRARRPIAAIYSQISISIQMKFARSSPLTNVAIRVAGWNPGVLPPAIWFLHLLCSSRMRSFSSCVISGMPLQFGAGVWVGKHWL